MSTRRGRLQTFGVYRHLCGQPPAATDPGDNRPPRRWHRRHTARVPATSITPRRLGWVGLLCIGMAGCLPWFDHVEPAPGSPSRDELTALLSTVAVIDERPRQAGYERGCGHGEGCVFGPAWTDATEAPGGRDGCDTRNNVLAVALRDIEFRAGTNNCVVAGGFLDDPYSGETIEYVRGPSGGGIEIDHIYPLSAAWHMGAHRWTLDERMRFANDVEITLLAVRGAINQDKGDATPENWMPPDPGRRCYFAGRFLTVAASYRLPITRGDVDALTPVIATCR